MYPPRRYNRYDIKATQLYNSKQAVLAVKFYIIIGQEVYSLRAHDIIILLFTCTSTSARLKTKSISPIVTYYKHDLFGIAGIDNCSLQPTQWPVVNNFTSLSKFNAYNTLMILFLIYIFN